jgi:pimeloyl-ACP methyl ester carboxylesterase
VFVGDREFLVRRMGREDGPDLVLIHGLSGSSLAEWYRVAPLLASRYRVTLVDHRSHGLSPKVTARFDVADAADEVAAVLERVGVHHADVVGYSMGGAIAQELAHRHPDRVRRLVLVATFTHHPTPWRVARVLGAWLVRGFERLTGVGTPETRAAYLLWVGAVEPRHGRWLWEETHRRDAEAGAAASFALFRFDSRGWVGRLGQPTLVVIPSRDQLVPVTWQYDLAAAIPDVRVAEVDGARHELVWTHPERVASEIDAFLSREA